MRDHLAGPMKVHGKKRERRRAKTVLRRLVRLSIEAFGLWKVLAVRSGRDNA
jgi:hypothetical protein